MRFVPSIPSVPTSPDTRHVMGLAATHAVKPIHPSEQTVPHIERHAPHQAAVHGLESLQHREMPMEDRRKACRRISHYPVLIELRSGIDRRHHTLRESDVVEHIDEEA